MKVILQKHVKELRDQQWMVQPVQGSESWGPVLVLATAAPALCVLVLLVCVELTVKLTVQINHLQTSGTLPTYKVNRK